MGVHGRFFSSAAPIRIEVMCGGREDVGGAVTANQNNKVKPFSVCEIDHTFRIFIISASFSFLPKS
jgi:hypothetical protein